MCQRLPPGVQDGEEADLRAHPFGEASFLDRRTASGVQGGRMDRAIRVAPGKQKRLWPGEPPISAQDGEQLRGKHRFAIVTTLSVPHED